MSRYQIRWTLVQRRLHALLSLTRELSNAQVAEGARVSEGYASRVLSAMARDGYAASRLAQDRTDPQTTYRLWRRTKKEVPT